MTVLSCNVRIQLFGVDQCLEMRWPQFITGFESDKRLVTGVLAPIIE